MLRTINLHGELAASFGRQFCLDISSANEAVRALSVQLRGFRQVIALGEYHVLVGGAYLSEDEILMEISSSADIDIVPVPAGSKDSGVLKVILGVALIGISFGVGASGLFGIEALSKSVVMGMGAGLALNGLGLMMSPTPTLSSSESADDTPSYVFSSALNITEEGNCIPLCYGVFVCGSLVTGSGLSVKDY